MSEEITGQFSSSPNSDGQVENTNITNNKCSEEHQNTTRGEDIINIEIPTSEEETSEEQQEIVEGGNHITQLLTDDSQEHASHQKVNSPKGETSLDSEDWLDGDSFATTNDDQQTMYNNEQTSLDNNTVPEQQTTEGDSHQNDNLGEVSQSLTDKKTANNEEDLVENEEVLQSEEKIATNNLSKEDYGEYNEDTLESIVIGEANQCHLPQPVNSQEIPMDSAQIIEQSSTESPKSKFNNLGEFPIESTESNIEKNEKSHDLISEEIFSMSNEEPESQVVQPVDHEESQSTKDEESSSDINREGFSEKDNFSDPPSSPTMQTNTNAIEEPSVVEPTHEEILSQEPETNIANNEDLRQYPNLTEEVIVPQEESETSITVPQDKIISQENMFVKDEDFGEFSNEASTEISNIQVRDENSENDTETVKEEKQSETDPTFEDFGEFPTEPQTTKPIETSNPIEITTNNIGFNDSEEFGEFPESDTQVKGFVDDEDFGDFPNTSDEKVNGFAQDNDFGGDFSTEISNSINMVEQQPTVEESTQFKTEPQEESKFASDDDFGEFPVSSEEAFVPHEHKDEDFAEFPTSNEEKSSNSQGVIQENEFTKDEDFGEFPASAEEPTNPEEQVISEQNDDFGDFPSAAESREVEAEDDFGDFATQVEEPQQDMNISHIILVPESDQNKNNRDEDDFGDFEEPTQEGTSPKGDDDFGGFDEPKEESVEEVPLAKSVEINYTDLLKDQKHVIDSILSIDQIKNEEEFFKVKQSVHNLVNMLIPSELAGNTQENNTTGESGNTLEKLFNMNSNHNADILSKMSVWQNSCAEKHFLLSLGMEKKKSKKLNKPLRKALHRRTASTTYSTPISGDTPSKPKTDTPNVDQRMKIDEIGNISQRMIGTRHRRVGSTVTDLHLSPRSVPFTTAAMEKAISPTTNPLPTTPLSTNMPSPGLSSQHADDLINSYTPSINTPSSNKPKNVELDDIAALVFGSSFASPTKETPKTEFKVATSTIKITTTSPSLSFPTPSQNTATNSFDSDDWSKNDSWVSPTVSATKAEVKPVKLDSPGFEGGDKRQSPTILSQSPSIKQEGFATDDDFGDFPEPKDNQKEQSTSTKPNSGWSTNDSWDDAPQTYPSNESNHAWSNFNSEPVKEEKNDSWEGDKWSEQPWEPSPPKTTNIQPELFNVPSNDSNFPEPKENVQKQKENTDDFGDFPEPKDHEPQRNDSWGESSKSDWETNDSWGSPQNSSWVDSFKNEPNSSWENSSINTNITNPTQQSSGNNENFGKEEFKPHLWESTEPKVLPTVEPEPAKVQTHEYSLPIIKSDGFGALPKDQVPQQDNNESFANDEDFGDFPEPQDHTSKQSTHDDFGDFPEPQDHEPQQVSWGSIQPVLNNESWLSAIPTTLKTNSLNSSSQLGGFDDWLSPVSTPTAQSAPVMPQTSPQSTDDWLSGSTSNISPAQTIPAITIPQADDWLSGSTTTTSHLNSSTGAGTKKTKDDGFGDFPEPKDQVPQQDNNQGFANDDDFGDFPEPQEQGFSNDDGFGDFQEPVDHNLVVPPVQPKPIGGFDDWLSVSTPTAQSTGAPQSTLQPMTDDWLSGSIPNTSSQPPSNSTGKQNDLFEFF